MSNHTFVIDFVYYKVLDRLHWPHGLRLRSAAARLLGLWVRIPQAAWMSVCFECCVLSGRGLCNELITRPEESYWLWCVVVCGLETSWMRRPWPTGGCYAPTLKNKSSAVYITPAIKRHVYEISACQLDVSNQWCVRQQSHGKVFPTTEMLCMISGFRHCMDETSILQHHCTEQNNNFMLTYWDIMLVPSSYTR
jgi:hypothetical protein